MELILCDRFKWSPRTLRESPAEFIEDAMTFLRLESAMRQVQNV